jgi:hypothetical protein
VPVRINLPFSVTTSANGRSTPQHRSVPRGTQQAPLFLPDQGLPSTVSSCHR